MPAGVLLGAAGVLDLRLGALGRKLLGLLEAAGQFLHAFLAIDICPCGSDAFHSST